MIKKNLVGVISNFILVHFICLILPGTLLRIVGPLLWIFEYFSCNFNFDNIQVNRLLDKILNAKQLQLIPKLPNP